MTSLHSSRLRMSIMSAKIVSRSLASLPARRDLRSSTKSTQLSTIKVYDAQAPHGGRIRIISLNRPEARNAISRQMLRQLSMEIDRIHNQSRQASNQQHETEAITPSSGTDFEMKVRALIIASEVDNCFCAGADLKEREGFSMDDTVSFLSDLRRTFASLAALPIPTITAINSIAFGGGLELALCTHFRLMANTAEVSLPETRLGIIPGAGGTYRLPALIGLSRARDLILSGRRVTAVESLFFGITDRVVEVPPEEAKGETNQQADLMRRTREGVLEEALTLAREICEGGPVAVESALQAVKWASEEVENQMYTRVLYTEDRNEALRAFREKRKPIFKGN